MSLLTYQKKILENQDKFDIYYDELVDYNQKVNLTAITEKGEVFTKHFLDSILPIDAIGEGASVIDVGAGAGFPSLPIKIVRPDIKLTMVDSLNKRINFLNYICGKLNVKSTNVHARVEEFTKNNREKFDVAVARAVAKMNTLLEYLLPLVKVGGIMIAYKGGNVGEEFETCQKALEVLGGKVMKSLRFDLPNGYGERNIVIIEKIKPTPKEYPRGKNLPKIDPIV